MTLSPRFRTGLFVASTSLFAIWTAADIANENYFLASCAGCVVAWLLLEWLGGPFPDAWLLGGAVIGYIVGNRGFAQFSPTTRLPLLPAEVALAVGGMALIIRGALRKAALFNSGLLDYSLLAWIGLGAARLPIDVHRFGVIAIRDFAMVYYAGFYFVAQALGRHAPSARLLRRAFTTAFALLPLVVIAMRLAPEAVTRIQWNDIPLIFHKSDLTAAGLGGGLLWFWSLREGTGHRRWLIGAAACLPFAVLESPRAGMVAAAAATLFWVLAGRWRLLLFQAAVAGAALILAVAIGFGSGRTMKDSAAYATYERLESLLDWSGTGSYSNPESVSVGENNRFRVVWWEAVARETIDESPWFGLGFGADLAARFLADYDLIEDQDFSARSPHSMFMSVFGRMGATGTVLWLLVTAGMVRSTLEAFRRKNFDAMGLWSVAWVFWVSGCFGIVLEGPMGAVVFWTAAGLANASTRESRPPSAEADDAATAEKAAVEIA